MKIRVRRKTVSKYRNGKHVRYQRWIFQNLNPPLARSSTKYLAKMLIATGTLKERAPVDKSVVCQGSTERNVENRLGKHERVFSGQDGRAVGAVAKKKRSRKERSFDSKGLLNPCVWQEQGPPMAWFCRLALSSNTQKRASGHRQDRRSWYASPTITFNSHHHKNLTFLKDPMWCLDLELDTRNTHGAGTAGLFYA